MLRKLFIPLLLYIGAATPSLAQDYAVARPLEENSFNESYDSTAAVSGSVVVGIRIGSPAGKLHPDNIRLAISSSETLCVRAMTRDGRFTSDNKYIFESSEKETSLLLSPVTQAYSNVLAGYETVDFAINAFTATNNECIVKNAVHLPQIVGTLPFMSTLSILVNSSSRTTMLKGTGLDGQIPCETVPAGARIAYDRICRLDIAHLPGGLTSFTITMDDGFGLEDVPVNILLPANKQQ